MARYTGPATRISRRLNVDLVGGDSVVRASSLPARPARPRRASSRASTCCSCRRSRRPSTATACSRSSSVATTRRPTRRQGKTGDNLLQILESRLDNVVYRAGLARTRRAARQLVSHGHFLVNGAKVDIPSYRVSQYDIIDVKPKSLETTPFLIARETHGDRPVPAWLQVVPRPAADPRAPAARAGADRHPGPGAADRRALLEVARALRRQLGRRHDIRRTSYSGRPRP